MTYPASDPHPKLPALRLERMTGDGGRDSPAAQEPPDVEIVARAIAGDSLALDLLVRRHYRAAYAVALAVMVNVDDAEDACHDAIVHALAHLHECREPGRFAQWLTAIVRNRARNALARPAVRRASAIDPNALPSGESTVRVLARDELRATLEFAMAQLSEMQREVVLMHDLYGMSHDDIADRIGTSAGMSRQHLFKARRHLRQTLGPDLVREYFDD